MTIDTALGRWRSLRGSDSVELPDGIAIRFINRLNRANHVHVRTLDSGDVCVAFWRVTKSGKNIRYLGTRTTSLDRLRSTVEDETGVSLS